MSMINNIIPLSIALPLPSQCLQHKSLTDSKRKYNSKDTSKIFCDKNSAKETSSDWSGPGWYKVTGQAGTQLSEHSYRNAYYHGPNKNSWDGTCSTHHGGVLQGGHPSTPGQTVSRTVCFREGSYCKASEKYEIEVTNCLTYYVYNLKTVNYCHLRYCTQ